MLERNRFEPVPDWPRQRLQKLSTSEVGEVSSWLLLTERRVHIMKASSPVFEQMFQSKMEEYRTDGCVMFDISSATLDKLITFMYNCSTENMSEIAGDILPPADKYEMLDQ
ncbi:hypothetical protein RvY_10966 [Ramazzottius varieornatus]|uniref:BTB domain-containing protein n=1 Tax=Ramazzottius varieornatus TaxID=947166 RepID=A0A1D1VIY3_RAMVA|nr:hypothetical protein RvY_10966 [Ramazzottius varieornatus]